MDASSWEEPVYQSVAEPLLFLGVPPMFLGVVALGTVSLAMSLALLVSLYAACVTVLGGVALYGLAAGCTRWEPQWWDILMGYLSMQDYYEG